MKTAPSSAYLPAALLASTLALPTSGLSFAEVARGALTLTTTGSVAYDTNLSGNTNKIEDTIFTLAPTLDYSREVGLGTIAASLGSSIHRYADFSDLDSEDLFANLAVSLPTPDGARQKGGFNAAYADRTDVDETVGSRVRAKTWSASFSGTYRAGPRTDLRTSLSYNDTTRDTFADTTRWAAGLGFDYSDFLGGFGLEGDYRYADTQSTSFTSGVDTSLDQNSHHVSTGLFYKFVSGLRASVDAGYRWIDRGANEVPNGKSGDSMTFSLRLDGPFLPASRFPKLRSSFAIGLEKGETLGLNDTGSTTVVGNLSLAWQARERTAVTFTAARNQGLSSANLSSVDNSVQLGVTQAIGLKTSLSGTVSQHWSSYPGTGRSDERTRASLNLGYALNQYWQFGSSYAYTLSRSSNDFLDYDRHMVSAFASFKF